MRPCDDDDHRTYKQHGIHRQPPYKYSLAISLIISRARESVSVCIISLCIYLYGVANKHTPSYACCCIIRQVDFMALKIHEHTHSPIESNKRVVHFICNTHGIKLRVISFFFERTQMCAWVCERLWAYECTYNFIFVFSLFARHVYSFRSLVGTFVLLACLFARWFHCFWPTKNSKMLLKSQYRIEPFYWKSAFTRISRLTFLSVIHSHILCVFFGVVLLRTFLCFSKLFFLIFNTQQKRAKQRVKERYLIWTIW